MLAAASTDRNVMLYDVRLATALKKVTLHMRANQIAWNPMEAFNFTVASEDGNCYSFDMRKLDKAQTVRTFFCVCVCVWLDIRGWGFRGWTDLPALPLAPQVGVSAAKPGAIF